MHFKTPGSEVGEKDPNLLYIAVIKEELRTWSYTEDRGTLSILHQFSVAVRDK